MTSLPTPRVTPLRGGPTLRWGVAAPGEIANDFTSTLHANTDQRVHAVGSRSAERAATFAARHGVARRHDSYEGLVTDPGIDVVYVAAPHSQHRAIALLAIAAGKHVLIEKPIALTAGEAREIAAAARAAGVFVMEAMWSRYLPQFDVVAQLVEAGELGEVRLARADVGWRSEAASDHRVMDPALGGGAMLDFGVYALWFAQFAIGRPSTVHAIGSLAATGVDAQAAIALGSGDGGADAVVTTSMLVDTAGTAAIHGTAGRVEFLDTFLFPARFALTTSAGSTEWSDASGLTGRDGLAWQATALARYVADGRTESPLHSLDDSIALMTTIDEVRRQLGAR